MEEEARETGSDKQLKRFESCLWYRNVVIYLREDMDGLGNAGLGQSVRRATVVKA